MGEAAPQAAVKTAWRPANLGKETRWRALKAALPEAELDREAGTHGGRIVRGRLAPDQPWTPWSMGIGRVLDLLEAQHRQLTAGDPR